MVEIFWRSQIPLTTGGLNFEPSVCNKNYQIQDHVSVLFIFYWGGGGVHVEAIHIDIA